MLSRGWREGGGDREKPNTESLLYFPLKPIEFSVCIIYTYVCVSMFNIITCGFFKTCFAMKYNIHIKSDNVTCRVYE